MKWRTWLEPQGQANSYVAVDAGKDDSLTWIDLTISDCSRTVSIGFNYSNERRRKARLNKLDRLQSALDRVRTELEKR